uniref:Nuclease n=1 Tax=Lygus hesperus TaxID=30085 RepID=A0A0A9WV10_LYGHE
MLRLAILLIAACAAHGATYERERAQVSKGVSGSCDIDARLDLSGKSPPVILVEENGEWNLAAPTTRTKYNSYLSLANKKIMLTCPGERNSLSIGSVSAYATCKSSNGINYFVVNGKEYKTDSIRCSARAQPYEYNTKQSCNGDGTLLKLGYMVNNKIADVITTCHRIADGMTYWSRHILDGSGLPQRGNGGKRPDEEGRPQFTFRNKDLFRGFPPYRYYKQDNELNALAQAIGSSEARQIFNEREDKFFSKGHLSPNADFLLETTRDVTFLFVNVQPQWQEVNGGNWNEVEVANRYNAAATGKKYEVITGAPGNLAPKSKNVFLDYSNQRIPVPSTYTKLIREVESNKCVALVSTNFPESQVKPKCKDICSAYNWPALKDAKKAGYVYCCSYDEFAKAFPKSAPKVDCSGGVLTNMNRG